MNETRDSKGRAIQPHKGMNGEGESNATKEGLEGGRSSHEGCVADFLCLIAICIQEDDAGPGLIDRGVNIS